METLPQSPFVAKGEIGHVWAPNPWNVSNALSPSHTMHSLLARVQDVAPMKQSWDNLCRSSDGNFLRPRQADQWAEAMEKSERDRWPGKSW